MSVTILVIITTGQAHHLLWIEEESKRLYFILLAVLKLLYLFLIRAGIYLDVREDENSAWVTYDAFYTAGAQITTEYFSEQVRVDTL